MVGFFRKILSLIACLAFFSGFNQQVSEIMYESENLIIEQITEDVFVHISYLKTDDYGKVKCNGAIFKSENEVIVLDTPTDDSTSLELIKWIEESLKSKVRAVVPTHAHHDCHGGISAFAKKGIASYANSQTITAAKADSVFLNSIPFDSLINLSFGQEKAIISFQGRGHTRENVVAFYPKANALFGGCLVKAIGAGKGYLGDADTVAWSNTIRLIKSSFPNLKIVIPGHGKTGDSKLLDYTATLFEQERN
ncbi:subclass B1 metallo-beta-lactamase [Ekhidna sp.]